MSGSSRRLATVLAVALMAFAGAGFVYRIGAMNDLSRQRVNVRWAEGVDAEARRSLEKTLGLRDAEPRDGRTWSYTLADHSHDSVERLVTSPQVDDTYHIDRAAYRVTVEDVGQPWRALVEHDLWRPAAFGIAALAIVWLAAFAPLLAGEAGWMGRRTGRALASAAVAVRSRPKTAVLFVVAGLTILALAARIGPRPDDSSFVHLYETPSILAGDHPYRDFYEWGAPLPAYLSAGVQRLIGYRVIGEVLLQDGFILAGVVVACSLGWRMAPSPIALLSVCPVLFLVLLRTSEYHYSKLFCFPVAVWLSWRYLDRPGLSRAAWLGAFVGLAFLFRHDYVIWVGFAAAAAILLSLATPRAGGRLSGVAADALVAALASIVTITPMALAVSNGEGLLPYVRSRTAQFEQADVPRHVFDTISPLKHLGPEQLPAAEARVVTFRWRPDVDAATRAQLTRTFGLTPAAARDDGLDYYRVANVYDPRLLNELLPRIDGDNGFAWQVLTNVKEHKPSMTGASIWLMQITLLVPLLLAGSAVIGLRTGWQSLPDRTRALQRLHAALFLGLVDVGLFRELGYFAIVAPLTAALGASFLAPASARRPTRGPRRVLSWTRRAAAAAVTLSVTYAAVALHGGLAAALETTLARLGQVPAALAVLGMHPPQPRNYESYLRDCTRPGDRLLVTGMTPFYIPYYTGRPMAGGHLYWHSKYRSDDDQQQAALRLLAAQSVPFAVSSSDRVMGDFTRAYPLVAHYLATRYEEVPGTHGRILVELRRARTGTFGPDAWPCFR